MSQDLWHLNVSSPLIQKGFFRWENGTLLLCFTNGVHTHHAWSAQILLQKICETQKTDIKFKVPIVSRKMKLGSYEVKIVFFKT